MSLLDSLARLSAVTSWQWGLVTTAQALDAGVSRLDLSRLARRGLLGRAAHGVYRLAGAPADWLEPLRVAWVSTNPRAEASARLASKVPDAVVSGPAAAHVHGIGVLVPEPYEFTVPARRQTQRDDLVYRVRRLEPEDVTRARELPVTTVERTIADLVDEGWGVNLVGGVVADVDRVDEQRIARLLAPLAARSGFDAGDGEALWRELQRQAGRTPASSVASLAGAAAVRQ
jgi:predicted transcriptional regulator of viral defense system